MAARSLLMWLFCSAAILLIESAMAVTFSSRLIHRFSDEMKSLRASTSKKEEVSGWWPQRRSLEYYRLLARSDLQRQKMKLGAQHQLLFPSRGSATMSLGNDFGWLHYMWIDVGMPNVSFLVALDTGSDLFWVPCDCVKCAPLSGSYYGILDRDLSEYSPSGSRTSKQLSCSHRLCELGPNCESPEQACPYTVKYYSEDVSSSGFLVEDILHLASGNVDSSNNSVQAPVVIGCGSKQSGDYLSGVAPDGLMGLGLGEISVPSSLAKEGLVHNSFSLCFNDDDSGRIFFGDLGLPTQQTTQFLPLDGKYLKYIVQVEACCIGSQCLQKTGFRAFVDSGTSFTYLPHEVYKIVVQEFDSQMNDTGSSDEAYPWQYCYKSSSHKLPKNPSLTLKFAPNNSFEIHNPVFVTNGDQGITGFCLPIQPTDGDIATIGQNYMIGYRMVFDRENLKLGWSLSNCQDLSDDKRLPLTPLGNGITSNPLPTTEQQSSPNGHGIAPAVAGRTPSKSSAASIWQFSTQICVVKLVLLLLLSLHQLACSL